MSERMRSLDVFRGATVAAMVLVNNPGDWGAVFAPLLHADWHGWTPTDLIFPFFLFIVGVAIAAGSRAGDVGGILRRGAVLWGLGLGLAAFPYFQLATVRIPGVLARIAWCYVAAALLVRAVSARRRRSALVAAAIAALVGGHWVALAAIPFPGGVAGDLTPAGNIGAWLDRALLGGHLWRPDWDPEGVLSTVPAIGTTLLGVLAGWWLRGAASPRRRVRGLLIAGLAGVVGGLAIDPALPINKALWTGSYVLFSGGVAAACLAVCHWAFDLDPSARRVAFAEPFVALGRNAILLFVLSGLAAKTLMLARWPDPAVSLGRWIYLAAFAPVAPPKVASLLFAVAHLGLLFLLMAALHRRRVYLRA